MNGRTNLALRSCAFVVVILSAAYCSLDGAWAAQEKSTGYQCTLKAVTCGAAVTTHTEVEACGVVEIIDLGHLPDKTYTEMSLFLGVRLGGEVLFLGGASAKSGMVIARKVPWDDKKQPDYDKLKKELPTLLMANPEVKRRFPKATKIELDKAIKFESLKPADVEAVKKAYPDAVKK